MPTTTPRQLSLVILGAYVAVALVAALAHRDVSAAASYATILLASLFAGRVRFLGNWLPWLALPILYWSVPATTFGPMHDPTVQHCEFAFFHSEPARDLAATIPARSLSEILHLGYLSYYAVIYLPPVAMYFVLPDERAFADTTLAFTLAMVLCFTGFALFPVQGPRYEWGASAAVPHGPFRAVTLFLLERGSAHGTAFPSSHVAIALSQTLSTWRAHRRLAGWLGLTTTLLSVGAIYGGVPSASPRSPGAGGG